MVVSHDYKIVFIAIPKTGTRSILHYMEEYLNGHMYENHKTTVPREFRNYFTFCVVRNPYSRIVSHWYSGSQRGEHCKKYRFAEVLGKDSPSLDLYLDYLLNKESYEDRLRWPFEVRQVDYLHNRIDAMLRFETIEEDFASLPFVRQGTSLGFHNPTVSTWKSNPIPRYHWTVYMTDSVVEKINTYFAEDFSRLGYPMYRSAGELLEQIGGAPI